MESNREKKIFLEMVRNSIKSNRIIEQKADRRYIMNFYTCLDVLKKIAETSNMVQFNASEIIEMFSMILEEN